MKTKLILSVFLVMLLSCREKEAFVPPSSKDVEIQASMSLGSSARVIYYHLDDERIPGLEEWIVEDSSFDVRHQKFSTDVVLVPDTVALQKMLMVRVPKLTLSDAVSSERAEWKHPKGSTIQCDVLYTKKTKFLFITKHP